MLRASTRAPRDHFAAAAAPTAADDASLGYGPGSRWLDTTTGIEWICRAAALGGAVWRPMGFQDLAGYASVDQIAPDQFQSSTDTVLNNAAWIFLTPLSIPHRLTVSSLGAWVAANGVGAGHVARLGLYKADLHGRPLASGGLILDGGTIDLTAGTTGQVRPVAVTPTELASGLVWGAIAWNVAATTAATLRSFSGSAGRIVPAANPLAGVTFGYRSNAADYTGGLPASLPALTATSTSSTVPLLVLGVQ